MGILSTFDKKLNTSQVEAIEDYLMKKHGINKACDLPLRSPDSTGYVLDNCSTTREKLTEAECKVTCDAGYTDVPGVISYDDASTVGTIEGKAVCAESGGKFNLKVVTLVVQ